MLGVTSCFVIGLEVYSMGGDIYTSGTINLVKSLSMRDHHPKQNVLLLLSQMNILKNCLLNVYIYTHRLMWFSAWCREAHFSRGWRLVQKLGYGKNGENKWLLSTQSQTGHLVSPVTGMGNCLLPLPQTQGTSQKSRLGKWKPEDKEEGPETWPSRQDIATAITNIQQWTIPSQIRPSAFHHGQKCLPSSSLPKEFLIVSGCYRSACHFLH